MIGTFSRSLKKSLEDAGSYEDWLEISTQAEQENGAFNWKAKPDSNLYDHKEVKKKLDELKRCKSKRDLVELTYIVNEVMDRRFAEIDNAHLYDQCLFGTKDLIQNFTSEVCTALNFLSNSQQAFSDHDKSALFFSRALHSHGKSAFMMSGGGMLLYIHLGVIRCLVEHDLLPEVISGSSGGAYVAAMVGAFGKDELMSKLTSKYIAKQIHETGQLTKAKKPNKNGALSPEEIVELMNIFIPDLTFAEAYEKTSINISIPVTPHGSHQSAMLLNAETTPDVFIHDAVKASSALPNYFPPVTLQAKGANGQRRPFIESRKWVDGSISDDLPAKKLSRLFGVNHFVVSQVHPLIVPILQHSESKQSTISIIRDAYIKATYAWLQASANIIRRKVPQDSKIDRQLLRALSIAEQSYTGDINILPPFKLPPSYKPLNHPTEFEIDEMMKIGERAAWSKIETIRLQTSIERTLSSIVRNR